MRVCPAKAGLALLLLGALVSTEMGFTCPVLAGALFSLVLLELHALISKLKLRTKRVEALDMIYLFWGETK
jgi:hypothetical protein